MISTPPEKLVLIFWKFSGGTAVPLFVGLGGTSIVRSGAVLLDSELTVGEESEELEVGTIGAAGADLMTRGRRR